MKNAFSTIIASSLLAATVSIASSLPAKADTLQLNLSDVTNTNTEKYPTVKVTLDDTSNPGKITVKVDVVPGSTGYIGDLRGVYFNLPGASNLAINGVSGGPLTATSTDGEFKDFSNSADLQGTKQSFNVGAEIGRQGIAGGDDYQSTTFTISGDGLDLSAFTSQSVGVRMMSVGNAIDGRDYSSKTLGTAPATVTVTNPPAEEPVANNPNPPAEEPAANPNPPAEEPAANPNPPAEEPVANPNPPAEEPVANNPNPPAEEPAANPNPPAEEPVANNPNPPAEEPAANPNPPAEEPVANNPNPPAEEPAANPNPPAEEPAANPNPPAEEPSNHVSVPEPATVLGLGLVGASLGMFRRKFNKKA